MSDDPKRTNPQADSATTTNAEQADNSASTTPGREAVPMNGDPAKDAEPAGGTTTGQASGGTEAGQATEGAAAASQPPSGSEAVQASGDAAGAGDADAEAKAKEEARAARAAARAAREAAKAVGGAAGETSGTAAASQPPSGSEAVQASGDAAGAGDADAEAKAKEEARAARAAARAAREAAKSGEASSGAATGEDADAKAKEEARAARAAARAAKTEGAAEPEAPKEPSRNQPLLDRLLVILQESGDGGITESYINERDGHIPNVVISEDAWLRQAEVLKNHVELRLDYLRNVSGVDMETHLEVVYHLISLDSKREYTVKVKTDRDQPSVPSVTGIWPTANWNEREIFDLFGIDFPGHPDLRRIMMADDWIGHPLRKDYEPLDPEV